MPGYGPFGPSSNRCTVRSSRERFLAIWRDYAIKDTVFGTLSSQILMATELI